MNKSVFWIIDFDETLATGSLTWAQEAAFPKLIRQYGLECDSIRLDQALMVAQEESSRDHDPRRILDELFAAMKWPPELADVLLKDILTNYQPRLYDDSLALLARLKQAGRTIVIVSNNPMSAKYATELGIAHLVDRVITSRTYPGARPKPHRDIWDALMIEYPELKTQQAAIVGDDPWADGEFARNCGIQCYLVDRAGRFHQQYGQFSSTWVRSLDEIVPD